MDDARAVRRVQRVGDLHAQVDDGRYLQRSRRHRLVQGAAAQQLHHEIGTAVGFRRLTDVVDRADVRMVERGCRARLPLEAQQVFFRCGQRRGQQLQRDVAAKLQVVRLIDLAHAARAERGDDCEAADDLGAWGEWHDAVLGDSPHSPEVPGVVEVDQAARVVVSDGEGSMSREDALVVVDE